MFVSPKKEKKPRVRLTAIIVLVVAVDTILHKTNSSIWSTNQTKDIGGIKEIRLTWLERHYLIELHAKLILVFFIYFFLRGPKVL